MLEFLSLSIFVHYADIILMSGHRDYLSHVIGIIGVALRGHGAAIVNLNDGLKLIEVQQFIYIEALRVISIIHLRRLFVHQCIYKEVQNLFRYRDFHFCY